MMIVEKQIRSKEEGAEFVRRCDDEFEARLAQLMKSIVRERRTELITLAGPTCSGKTTTAKKLTDEIEAAGKCAKILSIDDFFKERPEGKLVGSQVDFDTVAAIDLDYLSACVQDMLNGRITVLPHFDFVSGKRTSTSEYVYTNKDILILEGIQAVYPEVVALFSGYPYKSIFINVSEDISVNGVVFSATDVRLIRRIVRDYRFRSADPDFTFDIWDSVRANEEANIFPYMQDSDYKIESLQPYELFMIGQFALPLLEMVPESSRHYMKAMKLRDKLMQIRGNEIDPQVLSPNSLYHEFLG